MGWSLDPDALRGRVAVVAGATRGRRPRPAAVDQASVSAGELARHYGFTDVDGSQPDV